MKKPISLPIELFALVKSVTRSNPDRGEEPRWVQQVRSLLLTGKEEVISELSARLVVEYDLRPARPDMWDIHYMVDDGNVFKFQKDRAVVLDHKRCIDERGNLHNNNDAAFVSGEHKFYYLHGVPFANPEWITTPIEQIDSGRILAMLDVDQRAQMMRRKGIEQFLDQLFHRVIDKRGSYELIQVLVGDSTREFGTYLKMLNPSIGIWHMEGVPNNIRTVDEALGWRNNNWFVDADKIT